jgi:homoserine O-acetyltransferase
MTDWPSETGRFALGDLALQSGQTLPGAMVSWKTHGTLSAARDNVVLYPTSYSARHPDLEWLIGPDGVLDPERWFIVIPDMFANGLSSSPSNTADWPGLVTSWDNVHAQRRLLAEQWGIERLHCVYGWSMGAQQAYHWAALFPDMVARAVVNCGSARTATHNRVFLKGLMAVLEAAPEYLGDGRFSAEPACTKPHSARPIWTPSSVPIGRSGSPAVRPPICMRNCAPGRPATSAATRAIAAIWRARWRPSRRGCC